MGTVVVQIPVHEATAEALAAVTELVKLAVRPTGQGDALIGPLEQTAGAAASAGLTGADIEAELAAWKAERAARRG